MAMSLGGGRRRWVCRAARRGGNGVAGCRHFHVHYHLPRQVCTFSSLWLLPSFPLLPYLVIPLVLFFAVFAFLVLFGWFTLVYFVCSVLGKGNRHECFKSDSVERSSYADELCGEDDQGGKEEERAAERVAESARYSAVAEVSVKRQEIKEVFVDGFRDISRMASPDVCIDDEVCADDEKLIQEVMIFKKKREGLKVIADLDVSSESLDIPIDWFPQELNIREFSTSRSTAKLIDLPYGEEFVTNGKEVSGYTSSEIIELIDKHETRAVVDNGAGNDFKIQEVTSSDDSVHDCLGDEHKEMNQEQSIHELPVNRVSYKLPEEVFDEQHEIQNLVTEHRNKLPEDDSMEEDGKQIACVSVEAHHSVCEMSGLPIEVVSETKSETVASSDVSFDPSSADEDVENEKELTENIRVEASGTTSLVCAENHRVIRDELGPFANDDNTREVASPETLVIENTEDEDENNNDNCISEGASRRLPLIRRSPPPWWNLCGVLDVLAGSKD